VKPTTITYTAQQADLVRVLRDLKGAPLSCLTALWIMRPRPLSRELLIDMTRWEKDAVTKGMRLLTEVYLFTARMAYRGEAWCLTERGQQACLPLFGHADARALLKGDFSAFQPSSSSGLNIDSTALLVQETTTTTKSDFSAFPERVRAVIDDYLDGCPRSLAVKAYQTALERGETPAVLEYRTIAWSLYADSPLGQSIKARKIFVARKVEQGERCPDIWKTLDESWNYNHRAELRKLKTIAAEMDAAEE
jgi:hypothetical protein